MLISVILGITVMPLRLGKVVLFSCLCFFNVNAISDSLLDYQVYESDIDRDGDIDYLLKLAPEDVEIPYDINIQIERSAQQYLLTQNSDGSFSVTKTTLNSTSWQLIDAEIDEINYLAGGELEIAIRTQGVAPQTIILSQDSSGSLQVANSLAAQSLASGATASILDINNDGLEDVIISGDAINTLSSNPVSLKHDAVQNFAPRSWAGVDGAAHAVIDVFMPKELGPVPSLSIQYSSNTGNGLLGMGFNLSGVSKIYHCKPLGDVDGTMAAVAFSDEERLCLDGQYLVQTHGASRYDHNATFMTEIANHSRVRYKNASSENEFVIETKGGGKLIYAHARKHDQDLSKTIEWYLTRAEDEFGNGYEFTYKYTNQHQYQPLLETIEYGTVKVSLTWEPRANKYDYKDSSKKTSYNDEYLIHKGGSTTLIRDRLKKITVQRSNQNLRTYDLKYGVNHNSQSQLEEVEVCALNNACKSNQYDWFEGGAHFNEPVLLGDFSDKEVDQKAQFLDVNGDGIIDIMYPSNSGNWKFRLGSNNGFGESQDTGLSDGTGMYADYATPIKLGLDHVQGLIVADTAYVPSEDPYNESGLVLACVDGKDFYVFAEIGGDVFNNATTLGSTNCSVTRPGKVITGTLQYLPLIQWYMLHAKYNGNTFVGFEKSELVQSFGNRLYPVDVNNDGRQDLVMKFEYGFVDYLYRKAGIASINDPIDYAYGELLSVYITNYVDKGSNQSHIEFSASAVTFPQISDDYDGPLSFSDFNFDGIVDVEKCSEDTSNNSCDRYILGFNKKSYDQSQMCPDKQEDEDSYQKMMRENCLKRNRFIQASEFGSIQPYNKKTKQVTYFDSAKGVSVTKELYSPTYYADFNGDSIIDRMQLTDNGMEIRIYGGKFTETNLDYYSNRFPLISGDPFNVRLLDFNGDGLTDVLAEDRGKIKLYQSKRVYSNRQSYSRFNRSIEFDVIPIFQASNIPVSSFSGVKISEIFASLKLFSGYGLLPFRNLPVLQYKNMPDVFDYNGDGIADLVYFDGSNLYVTQREKSHVNVSKLRKITDSFSNTTEFSYQNTKLSPNTDFDNTRFPYVNISNTGGVVKSIRQGSSNAGYLTTEFEFSGAMADLQGRGFLGYGSRVIKNLEKGVVTEETYEQKFPLTGSLKSFKKYSVVDGTKTLLSSSVNSLGYKSLTDFNSQIFDLYVSKSVVFQYDLNGKLTGRQVGERTYDDFGNILAQVTTVYGGSSKFLQKQEIINEYAHLTTSGGVVAGEINNWRVGFKTQATLISTAGGLSRTQINQFNPKGSSNLVDSQIEFKGDQQELIRSFAYDDKGRLLSETLRSGPSALHKIDERTSFENSNFKAGYLPQTIKNASGHYATIVYDDVWHAAIKQINAQGIETRYTYDNWGDVFRSVDESGRISLSVTQDCGVDCPIGSIYKSTLLQIHKSKKGLLSPPAISYIDSLGRVIKEETTNANGLAVFQDYEYDLFSRLAKASLPYQSIGSRKWVEYTGYDKLGRIGRIEYPDGGILNYQYLGVFDGLKVQRTITNKKNDGTLISNQLDSITYSAAGNVTSVFNNQSRLTNTYSYDGLGNLTKVDVKNGAEIVKTVSAKYNNAGLKVEINDPDTGKYNYEYDPLGLMRKQSDARRNVYQFEYDKLNNQVLSKLNDKIDGIWNYSDDFPGILLSKSKDGFIESYEYDNLLRVKQVNTKLKSLSTRQFIYHYDEAGRLDRINYPSGFSVQSVYNPLGYLTAYKNPKNNHHYWQAEEMDVFGNWNKERFGNGITTEREFNPSSGLLDSILSTKNNEGDVQNLGFEWDTNGNLLARHKNGGSNDNGLSEHFTYDSIDRLIKARTFGLASKPVGESRVINYGYDAIGNLVTKSDLSDVDGMVYGANGVNPSRLQSVKKDNSVILSYQYDANGNMIIQGNRYIKYTAANKPSSIIEGVGAGSVVAEFEYDPSDTRFYQKLSRSYQTEQEVYYYGAGYEEVFDTDPVTKTKVHKQKAYVGGILIHTYTQSDDPVLRSQGLNGKVADIQYLHHDHLGSTETITDATGSVLQNLAFDPFGGARTSNWEDLDTINTQNPDWAEIALNNTSTGFTGHEMLADFNLIHMGGRLYDPQVGRMMSADPYIQAPYFDQSFNRYSYVWNNPLSSTDPSGYATISVSCGTVVYPNGEIRTCNSGKDNSKAVEAIGQKPIGMWSGNGSEHTGIEIGSSSGGFTYSSGGGYPTYNAPAPNFNESNQSSSYCFGCEGSSSSAPPPQPVPTKAESILDKVQFSADLLASSEIPFISQGAGVLNAMTYAVRGQWGMAGSSVVGLIPGFGAVADAGRLSAWAAKGLGKAKSSLKTLGKTCCFVAGTLVLTSNGHANIEDLEVGDQVLAQNTATGELEYKPITERFVEKNRPIYEIKVVDAQGNITAMETTDDHPFYVLRDAQNPYVQTSATHGQQSLQTTPQEAGNWKLSKDLIAGDRIRSLLLESNKTNVGEHSNVDKENTAQPLHTHKQVTVLSAEFTGNYDLTFNLSVADFHTYFVTDQNVLVHNCDKCKGGVCGVGGAHRDMTKPVGDGLDSHHMPSRKSNPSVHPNDGPAIKMDPHDHHLTSSNGRNGRASVIYQQKIADMIKAGNMRGAMAEEIRDARRASLKGSGSRSKYNKGIRQMLDYAKGRGMLNK